MPRRYSKGLRSTLIAAAKRQLSHNIRTEFLFETPAQQTRLQKAIRELFRKEVAAAANLHADVAPLRGNLTTGPERTPIKPWTPEQVEAYKKMRLEEVRQAVDAAKPWDSFFKDGPPVSEDFER